MQSQVVNVCPQYQSTYKFQFALNTWGNWLPNSAAAMRRLAVPTKGSRTRLPPETWNSFRTLDPSYFALPELGWPSANWALDPWGKKTSAHQIQIWFTYIVVFPMNFLVLMESFLMLSLLPSPIWKTLQYRLSKLEHTLRPRRICSGFSGSLFWSSPQNSR